LRKATRNYIIAAVMGLLALVQAVSGFVLWLALPCGGRGGGSGDGTFLFSRDVWLTIHDRAAIALTVIVIVHIILHWGWIVRMTKSYFGRE
jgi:cytochrome b subunit of formate dehydrogenase